MDDVELRCAEAADAVAVAACVQRAYARYAARLPYPPKPVLADYRAAVQETSTWLLEDADGQCVGVLVLIEKPDHLLLDNVAVDPACQKRGLGRRLLELAEVRLYTNALMTENRALYARIGYQEYDRRTVEGRDAVFMRKVLSDEPG